MRNKRIFITGGTGFFGKSLLSHCGELKQNDVVILSRNPAAFISEFPLVSANKRITFLRGDIRDFELPETDFDYIYHGAATSSRIIPDEEMRSVVIDGTRHILDFAKKNKRLSGFLFVSSGAVYGNKYQLPMKEDFPCEPVAVYGRSKLEAEKMCLESDVPCCIARAFAFVGEHLPLDAHFAMGNFIRDCLNNKPIVIKGDGTAVRTYLYAGDLARWLWTMLIHGERGRAYNLGSDMMISIGKLAETVRNVAGTNNEIQILKPPSGAPPECYAPDISRARSELGLEVWTTLAEAIRKTLEHHRRQEGR
ncbi:MAG: NAD(P)-dependent oxidoreductase [Candidatus Saganbacteria bacterium]|nr:NAD(P)-dependent oxidoreductase [Candidatus Saganbacteria bacterium]